MDSETQPALQPHVAETQAVGSPPDISQRQTIAPLWHTLLVVALILLNSYGGSFKSSGAVIPSARYVVYGGTFVVQLVFVLLIWFGISRKGVKMRDLIGGRWKSPEDFLIDFGIAIGFWFVSILLLFGLKVALGLVDIHHPDESLRQMKQVLGPVIPKSRLELGLFLSLTVFAGLFEEIIFRGYLQRQFGALAGNIYIGVIASGVLFGGAHGYQGPRLMVLIAVYGIFFGLLAVWRRSLRPGMIAHAWTDAISGVILFFS